MSVLRNLPDRIPFPDGLVQTRSAMVERSERNDPRLLSLSDGVAPRGLSGGCRRFPHPPERMQVSVRDDFVAIKLIAEDEFGREELEWRVEEEGTRLPRRRATWC